MAPVIQEEAKEVAKEESEDDSSDEEESENDPYDGDTDEQSFGEEKKKINKR